MILEIHSRQLHPGNSSRYEVKRFVMGHTVDPMGYDHCWNDPDWVWSELVKMFDKNEL